MATFLRTTTAVGFCLALAGCGGGGGSRPSFAPLTYSYLTPLRLNVGSIDIQDHAVPAAPGDGGTDLSATSPVPPDAALKQMAQDRLVAAGSTGTAVFTIDNTTITGQPGGTLDGTMAVHLDIVSGSGGHAGYAEAHVSRELVPGTDTAGGGLQGQLYSLTRQMMQDMNVELEFQLRRSLGDWLVDASGAPVASAVEQQSLDTPGGAATGPMAATPASSGLPAPSGTAGSVGAPMQLAPPALTTPGSSMTPPAAAPALPDGSQASSMSVLPGGQAPAALPDGSQASSSPVDTPAPQPGSPPPSFLVPPPGAAPVPSPAAGSEMSPESSGY